MASGWCTQLLALVRTIQEARITSGWYTPAVSICFIVWMTSRWCALAVGICYGARDHERWHSFKRLALTQRGLPSSEREQGSQLLR